MIGSSASVYLISKAKVAMEEKMKLFWNMKEIQAFREVLNNWNILCFVFTYSYMKNYNCFDLNSVILPFKETFKVCKSFSF